MNNNLGYNTTGLTLLALFIVLSVTVSPWWMFGLLGLWAWQKLIG